MSDLKYRGPLSSRGLRFIALLAMTGSQLAALFLGIRKLASYAGPEIADSVLSPRTALIFSFLQSLGGITFPLLLIASMSVVIRNREKIFRVMLSNFLLAGVTYFFIVFIAEQMVITLIKILPGVLPEIRNLDKTLEIILKAVIDQQTAGDLIGALSGKGITPEMLAAVIGSLSGEVFNADQMTALLSGADGAANLSELVVSSLPAILDGFGLTNEQTLDRAANYITRGLVRSHLNLNVFLDLFLCTVFWFFITYKPKKLAGGPLLLFRCCAVFPMLYLLLGAVLMGMNRVDWVRISLPLWLVGLLPSRKLPGILLFLAMALYVKYHEAEEFRRGGDDDTFRDFLRSNRHSLRFAVFMCIVLGLLSLADWGAGQIDGGRLSPWGIGVSTTMYLAIPFVLLFSYNREPRFRILNAFVPVYYVLNYLLLFLVALSLIYVAPQILNGVPVGAVDFSTFGN